MKKVTTASGDYLVYFLYLFSLPPPDKYGTRPFFKSGSGRRAAAHTRQVKFKNTFGPVGTPQRGRPRGQETNNKLVVYFHPFTIVSNVFMRNGSYPLMFIGKIYNSMGNGTYQLMFIGKIYNSMGNGTYPLMFIGKIYNNMGNGTYPLMFIGRIYNSIRNGTYSLMFIGRVYNSMRNGTYPLMFIGRVYNSMRNGTYPLMFIGRVYNTLQIIWRV